MTGLERFDIKYLKGMGEKRAKLMDSELGIKTLRDLLYTFPFRYIDRSRFYSISEFTEDSTSVQVRGKFLRFSEEGEGARKRLTGIFSDGSKTMEAVWFAGIKGIKSKLVTGKEYILFGKPAVYRHTWSMAHPEVDEYDPARIPEGMQGVYSLTETIKKKGISLRLMRNLVRTALSSPAFSNIRETLPAETVAAHHLMPLNEALHEIHFPTNPIKLRKARERFKFEELFYIQVHILQFARHRNAKLKGRLLPAVGENFNRFYSEVIPFDLTGAQKRVLKEIRRDMLTGRQMNRLIQGDVGCGKTLVAFMSMLLAADNGMQACLMAPTEILAHQHHEVLSEWCGRLGLRTELLTGSVRTAKRREIHEGLLSGEISFLVGTHALLEEKVVFRDLGLAVIDEQHRFGVAQRARLWGKSEIVPHVLVMTATPIPRTLAMTVYGDLDVSVIDELPPGRKPVLTYLRDENARHEVNRLLYREISNGRQAYIVHPLIRENEKLTLKSLEEGYEYACETFPKFNVCYVHGRMTPQEKEHQMSLFTSGEAQILVSTTVIEVGVNVPQATVMVIENAERFGLSQLHQLRGRVGRGADKSYCILMSKSNISHESRKRLNIMTATNDGFELAEADMNMRGPGDIEGTQQSGLAFQLRVASLAADGQILAAAREEAIKILDSIQASTGSSDLYSPQSISIIRHECGIRFANERQWSQIS